jgi:hypothetical protein
MAGWRRRRALALAVMLTVATGCGSVESARQSPDCSTEPPKPVARFREAVGSRPTGQEWLRHARDLLWDVYPLGGDVKRDLPTFAAGQTAPHSLLPPRR